MNWSASCSFSTMPYYLMQNWYTVYDFWRLAAKGILAIYYSYYWSAMREISVKYCIIKFYQLKYYHLQRCFSVVVTLKFPVMQQFIRKRKAEAYLKRGQIRKGGCCLTKYGQPGIWTIAVYNYFTYNTVLFVKICHTSVLPTCKFWAMPLIRHCLASY